jgi:dihydroneopterin aldolase
MDEIDLSGMIFYGTHGVNQEETELGQRFGVDLAIWLDLRKASITDDLNDTVSYSALYKLVRAEVEGQPSRLLEHLAWRIARLALAHDSRIERVKVRVSKLSPPLKGSATGEVAVSLARSRADLSGSLT